MSEAILQGRDLSLARGVKQLFTGLSFAVGSGCALVLRGPNGVGKTSLLRVLAGLTEADAGEVWIGARAPRMFNCWQKHVDFFAHEYPRSLYVGAQCDSNKNLSKNLS